jgi:hypothetical protein
MSCVFVFVFFYIIYSFFFMFTQIWVQLTWLSLQISHHMPWVYNFLYHFHPKVKKITTCKCKTYFTWIQTKIETYLITWDKSRFNSIFKIFKYAIWRKKMKNKLCHDIVETKLKLALNANQSINQSNFFCYTYILFLCCSFFVVLS